MSTIRKAYMEISNGIRGLRFHRDQSPSNSSSISTPPDYAKGASPDDTKGSSSNSSRISKSSFNDEESSVTCSVSRLFPTKSSTFSAFTGGNVPMSNSKSKEQKNSNSTVDSSSQLSTSPPRISPKQVTALSKSTSSCPSSSKSSSTSTTMAENKNHRQLNGDVPCTAAGKVRRPSKESLINQTKLIGSPKAGIACRIRKLNLSMTGQKWAAKPETIHELMMDDSFLGYFFFYFSSEERRTLCQVCRRWKTVLYRPMFWLGVVPVLNVKDWSLDISKRRTYYENFLCRGFDQVCLVGAVDKDISDFINNVQASKTTLRSVSIKCSNVSDGALENLISKLPYVFKLQLSNCNEVTGSGLWACLNPKITVLTITDCIHIADDTIGAIAQLLPSLQELNLQAYHVTDNGLALFDSKFNSSLRILRLKSCWEITNHGVVNIIHSLPHVTVLSLSGCSKITDDGIEIIAENMKKLKSLDISWCTRVTDASLEYVACDLGMLEELILDRCCHVTDIGVGYISTMTSLIRLFLRWCTQVGDFGLHHIFSMRNLRVLSIAGCRRLTSNGLYGLRHLQRLDELEVTNCPGVNSAVARYLKDNMPYTLIID